MSKRLAAAILVAFLLYCAVAGALVMKEMHVKENFYSPAASSRAVYGYESGQLGLLKKAPRKTEILFPAGETMEGPDFIEGADSDSFALDWSAQTERKPGGSKNRWSESLVGDDAVELIAFASWVPGPDDPLTNEGGWQATLTFRDPSTLEIIPADRLRELGVPGTFFRLSPPRLYQTPILRLLFRTTGMEYAHCTGLDAGDQRTGAKVSYDLSSSNDGAPRDESSGEWLRVDTELLIWHDSPIDCRLRFLTGEPVIAELEQKPGAQIAFGESLRVQWLAEMNREPVIETMQDSFKPARADEVRHRELMKRLRSDRSQNRRRVKVVRPAPSGEKREGTLIRASSPSYLEEHCGLMTGAGVVWKWEQEKSDKDIYLASVGVTRPRAEPLRLVFLPQVAELSFSLAGLPDMPNSREIDDLFDAKLPRITLPEDIEDAETQLLGFVGVGAQIGWERNGLWDESMRPRLPADRTFRDTTPQMLLDWYLDHTPGSYVRYDGDGLILRFNEEKPNWRDSIDELIRKVSVIFF